MTDAGTVVIGVGNPMRRDDGVGHEVIDRLEAATRPIETRSIDTRSIETRSIETVLLDGEPARLVEAWTGRRRAVVVDAVRSGARPGTIHEISFDSGDTTPLPGWHRSAGTHGAGVAAAIELGRALDRLPAELVVVGVESGDLSVGPGLSPAVAAAVDAAADRVIHRATS